MMNNPLVGVSGLSIVAVLIWFSMRSAASPVLEYFKPAEFGEWWPVMNKKLLLALDKTRGEWGQPFFISPVTGAIGRDDHTSGSFHNVQKHGEVKAIDFFPARCMNHDPHTVSRL